MRTAVGWVVVALVLVLAGGPAEARRGGGIVIINTGEDIIHVRDLDADIAAETGYGALGYKHARFGLFWLDFWRWDGEFVAYSASTYAPVDAPTLALLGGGSVPWRYRLPPGLLLGVLGIALAVLRRRRLDVRQTLIVAGIHGGLAALLYLLGLTWECWIPLTFGGYYGLAAWSAYRRDDGAPAIDAPAHPGDAGDADDEDPLPELRDPPARPRQPVAVRDVDLGPARPALPGPVAVDAAQVERASRPLVVQRPETAPAAPPIVHDASVDGPKLLR